MLHAPTGDGAFEVSIKSELFHSKFQAGWFPSFDKLVKTIHNKL